MNRETTAVHPRWLTRCYMLQKRVPERHYEPTFYRTARQCGTRTVLGYPDIFWDEVGLFYMAQGQCSELGRLLRGDGDMVARHHSGWRAAVGLLQDTVFWGATVRNMNWRARRLVMMALARYSRMRSRHMRRTRKPAHLLTKIACLPDTLVRTVVEFI
jgi:hypothetical protein